MALTTEGRMMHYLGMLYRRFPRIENLEVSALGLGCMRLPLRSENPADIDEAKVDILLRAAVEAGINYVDNAYPYHGGHEEEVVGASLERNKLRDKVNLATKSPVWLMKQTGDFERILDEQLKRLRTDHIDFYLLHALSAGRWEEMKKLGALRELERFKSDGRIRHIGFSFHDSLPAFKQIIDEYPNWEFCQIQYNYMDVNFQAGDEGIKYAAGNELGLVVMEPLRGGLLAKAPSEVHSIFEKYPTPRSPAEWALRFVLEHQEVVTVLSGMGKVEELLANAAVADSARPNSLTQKELALIVEARNFYRARQKVPCTGCGYCQPCPRHVSIPDIFEAYNSGIMFDAREEKRKMYKNFIGVHGASACVRCGACLSKCPQKIAIPDRLAEAHSYLS